MSIYKWDSAREWLDQKVQTAAANNDTAELVSIYNTIIGSVDNDTIQDGFQSEMDADGFFRDLDLVDKLTGLQCIKLLVEAGEDEAELIDGPITVEQMRQKISAAILDGSIAWSDVENA